MISISINELKFNKVDWTKAPEELCRKNYHFVNIIRKERDPDDPPLPWELWLQLVREEDPKYERYNWVVLTNEDEEEKIIGSAGFNYVTPKAPNYETDKHLVGIRIQIHPEYRKQGIAKCLLGKVLEALKKITDVTKVFGGSYLDAGKKFCIELGGKESQIGSENRLKLEEVNWDMMKEWRSLGEDLGKRENVKIEFFEDCPEDIIQEYTEIYTETMNQQPLGDYDGKIIDTPETRREEEEEEEKNKKRRLEWYTMVTREKDGKISGLTEMLYHPDTSHKGYQNLTGVKEKYRGKGLGKWLKAAMLFWYHDKYPNIKYISTGNADTNAPMLSINERMGFKTFISNTEYSFEAEKLYDKYNL